MNWVLSFIGFALAVAYFPEMSGASVPPRYAVMGFALVLLLFTSRPKISAGHVLGALFLTWAAVSFFWSPVTEYAQGSLLIWILLGGVFVLGASLPDVGPFYIGLAIGIGVNSGVALAQWGFLWGLIAQMTPAPAGLFLNRNTLCDTAMLALISVSVGPAIWRPFFGSRLLKGIFAKPPLWMLCLPSIALTHSRAAMIAVGATFSAWLWKRSKRWTIIAVLVFLSAAAYFGLEGYRAASALMHLNIALDTLQGLSFWGHGIGSYQALFPKFATHVDTSTISIDHAHSDLLEIASEFGAPGLLLILSFIVFCLHGRPERERLVLIAFLVDGLFAFPLYLPATSFIAALAAGHLCRDRALVWRELSDRGVALFDWFARTRIFVRGQQVAS